MPRRAAVAWSARLAACALLAAAGGVHAASFPCEKARSPVEKAICADGEISALDEHMGRYYAAARAALQGAEACLQSDQREWIRARRDICRDAACLRAAYVQRLAELDPLQPGVTRIRNMELPAVKALAWIVPPAADKVAAPDASRAKPLVARGTILDEVATGDGFVLRSDDGTRRLLVALMFLEPPTVNALASLARLPGAKYEARGHAEVGGTGVAHFAPSRCVFIHREVP